jgi:hypothetical protein
VIRLTRLPEPAVLTKNGTRWTKEFVDSSKDRPVSRRYAHKEVKATLRAISHGKCFYCEEAVPETEVEVDHYVEVAEDRELAYAWTNLYLSCRGCNDKLPEATIPRTSALDPFDPAVDPAEHLRFEDEKIYSRGGSARGQATIGKYKLGRMELDLKRLKVLQELNERLIELLRAELGWRDCEPILREFPMPDRPFSAMVRDALGRRFP